MRPLLDGDLIWAARVVVATSGRKREDLIRRMFREVHAADLYRKRFGRSHPEWGNGSLMDWAQKYMMSPREALTDAYLVALVEVIEALRAWKRHR